MEFKIPWLNDKVDSDQEVVDKELSLCFLSHWGRWHRARKLLEAQNLRPNIRAIISNTKDTLTDQMGN